jgi:hypothetical protein
LFKLRFGFPFPSVSERFVERVNNGVEAGTLESGAASAPNGADMRKNSENREITAAKTANRLFLNMCGMAIFLNFDP